MAATAAEPLGFTIPDAATEVGLKPDRLRLLVRRNAEVARFFQSVGPYRLVSRRDLPKLREVLVGLGEIQAETPTADAAEAEAIEPAAV